MHQPRSRFLCVLLTAILLVSAITSSVAPVSMQAEALGQDVGFSAWNGYCYTAKATTTAQGMEAYKIAATQTSQAVADKVYNILFNATYRITDFGGTLWPIGNGGSYITSMYDEGLGTTVNWNWRAMGCYSYALFVSQYLRGSIGRDHKRVIYNASQSASVLRNAIQSYADPGELIDFTHSFSEHSISYLAEDADGFYFISDNGDSRDIRLYYATYEYFASKCYGNVELFDTNNGKDVKSGFADKPAPEEPTEPVEPPTTESPAPENPTEPQPPVDEPTEPPTESFPTEPELPPEEGLALHAVRQYNGHTYILYTGTADYAEAKEYAETSGGYLATITTAKEQQIINDLLADAPVPFAWIGLENSFRGGNCTWSNGEETIFTNYASAADTSKHQTGFAFTEMLSSGSMLGKWGTCLDTYKYNGVLYTADKFGFVVEYGKPFNDGIKRINTIRSGNTAYVLYECDITFDQAVEWSANMGGHLASIESLSEYELLQLLSFEADAAYWLGAKHNDGKWAWLDGTPLNKDLPLPTANAANGLQMKTDAGKSVSIGSVNKNTLGGFICEIKLHDEAFGDVDLDGEINSTDARVILRHSVGICNNCIACASLGDVNHDNSIDSSDARLLLRAAVKLENTSSWGKTTLDEKNNLFQ